MNLLAWVLIGAIMSHLEGRELSISTLDSGSKAGLLGEGGKGQVTATEAK